MNIKFLILLFLTAFILQNCKKSPDFFTTEVDLIPFYFSPDSLQCKATKEVPGLGSSVWNSNTSGQILNGNLVFYCLTFQDSIFFELRELLVIGNIPLAKGNNILGNDTNFQFGTYNTAISDGDLFNAAWNLDLDEDNFFEITELDTISHLAKGTFDLHFKMTRQGNF
jgi:hypothetical protein